MSIDLDKKTTAIQNKILGAKIPAGFDRHIVREVSVPHNEHDSFSTIYFFAPDGIVYAKRVANGRADNGINFELLQLTSGVLGGEKLVGDRYGRLLYDAETGKGVLDAVKGFEPFNGEFKISDPVNRESLATFPPGGDC